jgi:cellulose synthase (UDP-forming)
VALVHPSGEVPHDQPQPVRPAPSSRIAEAARRFGDDYPPLGHNVWVRLSSVLLAVTALIYIPWLLIHLNVDEPWVAIPFVLANILTIGSLLLTGINTWHRSVPPRRVVPDGAEPQVAVIIPTCGEAIPMILRTIVSVVEQDWPAEKLTIIVSDDAHDAGLEAALAAYPVVYHSPPPRWSPGRDGAAKAGNLNSVVALLDEHYPDVEFIETRDADDEVGSSSFLRLVIGQLIADERLAYVQTIKEAQVSAGDPFNNRESMFYRNQMLSKNAANAVFPCGSGVVWRRRALTDIGNFPTWNLVEDIQSGWEALRRGWNSMYLPIVGAVGQHAPEDVPNVYKQRGTWAVDSVRLTVWADRRGLNGRQRAHFAMVLLFYITSFATLTFMACVVASLLGHSPVNDESWRALLYILPFALANELYMLVCNHPYFDRRAKQRHVVRSAWRVRVLWTGMAPVFARATLMAVFGGRKRKPVYKVTRKEHDYRWHWRETLPHMVMLLVAVLAAAWSMAHGSLQNPGQTIATVYFGVLYFALLASFINRGWHGTRPDRMPTVERRRWWPPGIRRRSALEGPVVREQEPVS